MTPDGSAELRTSKLEHGTGGATWDSRVALFYLGHRPWALGLRRELAKQRRDRLPRHRILPVGRELGERSEDESPLAEAWMRQRQRVGVEDEIVVEDEIEIERPRRARGGTRSTSLTLEIERTDVQRQRRLPNRPSTCRRSRTRTGFASRAPP